MLADWIVEPIDVIDDGSRCLFVGFVLVVVHLLDFETAEETFHRCVVIAVAFAAHALLNFALFQLFSKRATGVLRTSIAVKYQARFWCSECDGLMERIQGQFGVNILAGRPAYDLSRTEIHDRTQVTKAFFEWDVSEVRQPNLIEILHLEISIQNVLCDGQVMF